MLTLTKSEFEKSDMMPRQYETRDYINTEKLTADISEFFPAQTLVRYSIQDGKKYFEGADTQLILSDNLKIRVQYNEYKKKYGFWCESFNDLKNITYNTRSQIAKNHKEPNQIGVLTTAKIQAWVNYYRDMYADLVIENNRHANEIQAFRDAIKNLPVEWNGKEQKNGRISINGIRFRFEIGETYVSTYTEIDAYPSGLDTFLKLSDNKFRESK